MLQFEITFNQLPLTSSIFFNQLKYAGSQATLKKKKETKELTRQSNGL